MGGSSQMLGHDGQRLADAHAPIVAEQEQRDAHDSRRQTSNRQGLCYFLGNNRNDGADGTKFLDGNRHEGGGTGRAHGGNQPLDQRSKSSAGCIHRVLRDR